ncbi:S8 family serine peptidase [Pleomorphomonas sp. PLEO]|uniref:S8 family peptidase n=1 Tax=Pleomorphomonas sp. PLEO TaxID=3239306 RepID=UPI00351EBE77
MIKTLAYSCSVVASWALIISNAYGWDIFHDSTRQTQTAIDGIGQTIIPPSNSDLTLDALETVPTGPPVISAGEVPAEVPIARKDSAVIQFKPQASQAEIQNYISKYNMTLVETYPSIGAVRVETDLGQFSGTLPNNSISTSDALEKYLHITNEMKQDPLVLNATPDFVLKAQEDIPENESIEMAQSVIGAQSLSDGKTVDWGVTNIGADRYWDLAETQDGTVFGVMDTGFSRHEDLSFVDFNEDAASDHGNHVAGIACARHNSKGVNGVLPNCFIRARSSSVTHTGSGQPQLQLLVTFGQVLAALQDFVGTADDVKTFNVSLGYNWMASFKINPDAPESDGWRALVESQGVILLSMLNVASQRDKFIFSAAGNDSTGLQTPIRAKYSSPMNWAAIVARETGQPSSAVVVEAHDRDGKRAPFSDVGGDLSCPGVDILSVVAFDSDKKLSRTSYGRMSGTSMAAPYCAAGFQLFRMMRPKLTGKEALECLKRGQRRNEDGVPEMFLPEALGACPASVKLSSSDE